MLTTKTSKLSVMIKNQGINTVCLPKLLESPPITDAYCVSRFNNPISDKIIKTVNGNSCFKVFLKDGGTEKDGLIETCPRIPIIFNVPITSLPFISFNFDRYFSNLESYRFGHTVVYSEVTTSTIHLIEPLTSIDGIITIAGQQTQGKGRAGNYWHSPKGCAMFSLSCHIPLSSQLGKSLGLFQHLIALAIHRGITRTRGYEKSDLHLKWPNDIYWGRNIKLGGTIVTSSCIGNDIHCVAHCGLNVNNSYPATPLNHLLANHPETKGLPPLTVEEVIARTANEIDYLIKETERADVEMIKKLYQQHWLHTDQKIKLQDDKEVIIKGIDDHGYMLVQDSVGNILTVEPDGNQFDMMNNLMVKK